MVHQHCTRAANLSLTNFGNICACFCALPTIWLCKRIRQQPIHVWLGKIKWCKEQCGIMRALAFGIPMLLLQDRRREFLHSRERERMRASAVNSAMSAIAAVSGWDWNLSARYARARKSKRPREDSQANGTHRGEYVPDGKCQTISQETKWKKYKWMRVERSSGFSCASDPSTLIVIATC